MQTKEEDLQKFFCSFGRVKHTNIKRDRAEISKGLVFIHNAVFSLLASHCPSHKTMQMLVSSIRST